MKSSFFTVLLSATLSALTMADTISIKGSDTLGAKLIPQLTEAYVAAGNQQTKFEIAAEGSSTAFSALANSTAQIGMSSRKAKEEEITLCKTKGVELVETPICNDMLCVIVNKNCPIKNLTKAQIAKIFTGQIKDWSEIGGTPGKISIYTRNTSSGTYKDWQHLAMDGRDYPANSMKMAGNEQIAQEVSKNKNGIGYVGLAYSKTPGTKTLNVEQIEPTPANAAKYAYSRVNYLYTPAKAPAEVTNFLQFIQSPAGQTIITKVGFIPHS